MSSDFSIEVKQSGHTATFYVVGHFDQVATKPFRTELLRYLTTDVAEVVVDFGGLVYIDSLAMGILLLCRNSLMQHNKTMVLANCRGLVLEALRMGNFHKIFEMR